MKVLIVSYSYYPAAGGAANYTQTLARLLAERKVADEVEVLTERFPNCAATDHEGDLPVSIHRLMPRRATRDKRDLWSLVAYGIQLIQIALYIIRTRNVFNVVLLHGTVLYRTMFIAHCVRVARWMQGGDGRVRYILDIRDLMWPEHGGSMVKAFDGVIACSHNVLSDLVQKGVPNHMIRVIPIPVSPHSRDPVKQSSVCAEFGLRAGEYVLVAHGFTPGKRTEDVIEAVSELRRNDTRIEVVVVGRVRSWPEIAVTPHRDGWLHYLGALPNDKVRDLMEQCLIHVNVCTSESIGRASLEAIAAGALTILPPGVPEFEGECRDWIGTPGDPERLAKEIGEAVTRGKVAPYPIGIHDPHVVAREYREIFMTGCSS